MSPEYQAEPQESPQRVLLVEDDAVLRSLLAEAMRELGLTVIEAASADQAARYLQSGGGAEIVFSDVEMPGSMNGIGLAVWIRRHFPEMPLILTSGTASAVAGEIFMAKPYRILEVAELVRGMLQAKRGVEK